MGRSVISASDATAVAYRTFGPDEDFYQMCRDELEDNLPDDDIDLDTYVRDSWDDVSVEHWIDFKDWIVDTATRLWPSCAGTRLRPTRTT